MSAGPIEISSALLASVSKPCSDPVGMRAWETGENVTRQAKPFQSGTVSRWGAKFAPLMSALQTASRYGAGRRYLSENLRAARHELRRKRGGDGRLPDKLRSQYTEGQRAALSVIGQEVAAKGKCEIALDAIAQRAGVGIRTVQYAIRRAAQLGHLAIVERPQQGRRSLTNLIRVKVKEWMDWLQPRRSRDQAIGCKGVHTTENKGQKEESGDATAKGTRALEGEQAGRLGQPDTGHLGKRAELARIAELPARRRADKGG